MFQNIVLNRKRTTMNGKGAQLSFTSGFTMKQPGISVGIRNGPELYKCYFIHPLKYLFRFLSLSLLQMWSRLVFSLTATISKTQCVASNTWKDDQCARCTGDFSDLKPTVWKIKYPGKVCLLSTDSEIRFKEQLSMQVRYQDKSQGDRTPLSTFFTTLYLYFFLLKSTLILFCAIQTEIVWRWLLNHNLWII